MMECRKRSDRVPVGVRLGIKSDSGSGTGSGIALGKVRVIIRTWTTARVNEKMYETRHL